jgi:hypothetical protein
VLDTPRPGASLKNLSLIQLAGFGFLIGVLLHACIALAVLDDGTSSVDAPSRTTITTTPQPTATVVADRTSCEEIRGTDYRSNAERQWFIANCT